MTVLLTRTPYSAGHTKHAVVACAFLMLFLLIPLASAADFNELQVSETNGVYSISLVMQLQAPVRYVHHVLTDYERVYRLDPAIVDSEVLSSPDEGVVRVKIRIHDCIGFFCMTIDRVEDVRELDHGSLQVTTVPALSSFKSGHAEWTILRIEGRSQVTYQAQMEPDFFIPPLIGSYFVKQKLRKSILASLSMIECIARVQAGLEPNPELDQVLVAEETPNDHAVGTALLAGQDPTLVALAPAAGSTVSEYTGCARPCSISDTPCQL